MREEEEEEERGRERERETEREIKKGETQLLINKQEPGGKNARSWED